MYLCFSPIRTPSVTRLPLFADMSSDNSICFGDCPKAKKSRTSEDAVSLWTRLPSVVVHEIFDLLSETDRQNASVVCKNWRTILFHPKWWSKVTFKIDLSDIARSQFFTSVFGKIVSAAKIEVNTLTPECTGEFLALIETLSDNNNLKELIIEPSHTHFYMSECGSKSSSNMSNVIRLLKLCLPNLVKFSIGCVEDFSYYLDEYLTILANKQPDKILLLGLASVKDNPNEYEQFVFDYDLIKPFINLEVLSIDYDHLSDRFLSSLDDCTQLKRLVVHVHGVYDEHPGTSDSGWIEFKKLHHNCEFRLTVIHSYEEVGVMHETVLRREMPLTHLKVFFCENINLSVLDLLSAYYAETLRSVLWVDSLSNCEQSWALVSTRYSSPDPFIMIAWLCKKLEELVFYGYKYCEENLVAIARLQGDKLKHLEIAKDDIFCSNKDYRVSPPYMIDVPLNLRQPWAPTKTEDLHPVIRCPTAGDSDEYMLPIVLADLH